MLNRGRLFLTMAVPAVPAVTILTLAGTLAAHDFWLVPNAFQVSPGGAVEVLGQTSSRFPTSESAVAVDRVADARLLGASSESAVTALDVTGKSLRLRARPEAAGQYVVAASLHWRAVRESAESFRRYLRLEGAPAALEQIEREGLLAGRDSITRRYAKYAKTLVQVGRGGAHAFARRAGHPLEFLPASNPLAARPGDTLVFSLTFGGKPLAGVKVHASAVDWAPPASMAAPKVTAGDVELVSAADGTIRVPVSAAGLWNLRTIHVARSPAGVQADWDAYWATLVFLVPGAEQEGTSDSLAVAEVVAGYHEALHRGDSVHALRLLAPDAVILEGGGVETREQYRGHHLPADIGFARAVPSERGAIRVVVRGDVAWASSTSTSKGTFRGRAINSRGAELMVLRREGSQWLIQAIHWSSGPVR